MWNLSNRIAACGARSRATLRKGFHMSITISRSLPLFSVSGVPRPFGCSGD
jgi:hypothetical protein